MYAAVLVQEDASFSLALLESGLIAAGYTPEITEQSSQLDIGAVLQGEAPELLVLALSKLTSECITQIADVDQHYPCPVLVWIASHDPEVLDEVIHAGVSSYVCGDVQAEYLELQIALAKARFKSRQKLKHDAADAKKKLRERKLVERAKGLLMEKKKMSERTR